MMNVRDQLDPHLKSLSYISLYFSYFLRNISLCVAYITYNFIAKLRDFNGILYEHNGIWDFFIRRRKVYFFS